MPQLELHIEGMTCEHCARGVAEALESIPGVRARVSHAEAKAWVSAPAEVSSQRLLAAVRERGYGARLAGERFAGGQPREVVIIGSGSAAMACATTLAEAGVQVTVVEKGTVGGTCVNIGCVPSKILIAAARLVHDQRRPAMPGVRPGPGEVDWSALRRAMMARVAQLRAAKYESILDGEENIRLVRGEARFLDAQTLAVRTETGETRLQADRFLVAVGARPDVPRIPGLAATPYWTSTEALFSERLPTSLLVLGGGVIACELAQAHARLGVKVTVVTRSRLLSRLPPEVGESLAEAFAEEGIEVIQGVVESVDHGEAGFGLRLQDGRERRAERLLLATGRVPDTQALHLEAAGVATDGRGHVQVDDRLRTSQAHIYAAGDCTDLPQFVYVAARAGTVAAHNMLGEDERLDLSVLPQVVFTDPQVATVGAPPEAGREVRTLPLAQVPRALAEFATRGFITLVAGEDGRLLGAQIVSPRAGEVVQSAALAIGAGMTVDALGATLFPYLTEVEGLKLAAQTFHKDVSRLSCCAG